VKRESLKTKNRGGLKNNYRTK